MRDFENFTIQELEEALSGIDRAEYPQRTKDLSEELARKRIRASELRSELSRLSGRPSPPEKGADFLDFLGSFVCSWGLLIGLAGLAGVFGADTVTWNDGTVHGMGALIVSLFLLAFSAVLAGGSMYLGYLLFSRLRRG